MMMTEIQRIYRELDKLALEAAQHTRDDRQYNNRVYEIIASLIIAAGSKANSLIAKRLQNIYAQKYAKYAAQLGKSTELPVDAKRQIQRIISDTESKTEQGTRFALGYISTVMLQGNKKALIDTLVYCGVPGARFYRAGQAVLTRLGGWLSLVAGGAETRAGNDAAITAAIENDLFLMTEHFGSCPICLPYQGRVFSYSGQRADYPYLGDTGWDYDYQSFHPNCRHVIVPYIEDMRSDVAQMKDYSNRDFAPGGYGWTQEQTDKYKRELEAYKKDQQAKARAYNNRKQYARYQSRLGEDAPGSYSAFMRAKNAGGEKWNDLQREYRNRKEG